ncbi:undecaprenyl-diphosphate phosphatase [Prochlorococcus sp. MIT 1341]|uniref:undecaprenyl-diphosphate phosphatase n=1 Tax=Prochlorococcus sp. MIT 1341 TaxID=3096221 RepID=UPI002A748A9C|nr:undecaprenyl-diphosphate phosphatase [Prochlorococcus sp. MIT 1341]
MTDISTSPGLLELSWRYLLLGVIQGITEFLPISSTAHLKVVPVALGWPDPGVTVTAVLQLGSIFAVFAYFRRDLNKVLKGILMGLLNGQWNHPDARLGISIFWGTIPILFCGGLIKFFWKGYEDSFFRSTPSIGLVSILMALFLAFAERKGHRHKSLKEVKAVDGLIVGFSQIMALIPGVSRSGVTLSTALLNGWERRDAARFSFLLGIPAITMAGLVEVKDVLQGSSVSELLPLLVGMGSAAFISWLSIRWLLKYLQSHSTWIFVGYRMFFGIALLASWASF